MVERKWRPNTRPQDVRVGKHFMLSDFLYSQTAVVRGIPNCPSSYTGSEVKGIKGLCKHILDPVVDRFGSVSVTFGFCSLALWHHWYPSTEGTEPTSLHLFRPPQGGIGGACDILIHAHKDPRPVFNWIRQNCVYDRLIIYPGSSIICVAWCEEKPRYHAKEWVFPENGGRAEYVNAGWDKPPVIKKESEIEQTSLFDLLNQPQDCFSFLLSPNANLLSLIHQ
ncbi:MAG TPA: hypothetical protein VK203_22770 [Nostocaceae cyanobacterium]|nr:hypothetical protein [Nostocaceae cyanobacterium]